MSLRNARSAFFYLLIPAILLVFVFSFISSRDSTDLRYAPHAVPPAFVLPNPDENSESIGTTIDSPKNLKTSSSTFDTNSKESLSETITNLNDNKLSSIQIDKETIHIDTAKLYSKLDLLPLPNETNPWTVKLAERFRNAPSNQPLKVIIVPHSHNDPGWLSTYDHYYSHFTNAILDSAVKNLGLYPNMTFVWSEMSFLSRWWDQQHSKTKAKFKKFIDEGRLEITTGGWVMTDEGPAHFYDMLEELIEGHQFLKNSLGVKPKNSWSVDPFGHGSTFPYLLQESGIDNIYIQRTHFAWKRYLSEKQQLEFFWKQPFQENELENSKKILCHMSPLELYSYKYACGPDYKVCLNFDFRKIFGEHSESTAEPLNKQNIHNKSLEILEQYQKLGSMFTHNVALVLLGDDFRYNYDIEWKQQYENYELLMDYINSNPTYFNQTQIKFGTLNDYFNEIFQRQPRNETGQNGYPNLVGDFMPYADVYVNQIPNYWTGYYSTRPFLKFLNRQLQQQLRSTEILYTLSRQYIKDIFNIRKKLNQEYHKLIDARQNLGLFQHHDGITGTSRDYVMADYGSRMSRSLNQMRNLAGYALQNLALDHEHSEKFDKSILNSTNAKRHWDNLDESKVFKVPAGEQGLQILVFNSHLQKRFEKVRIQIEDPFVRVVDAETGEKIHFQINPVFESLYLLSSQAFELEFGTIVNPLSLKTFRVITEDESIREKVTIVQYDESDNPENQIDHSSEVFQFEKQKNITLENEKYKILFDHHGFMKEIFHKNTEKTYKISMDFLAYESVSVLSGAYLFKPANNNPEKFLNYSSVNIHQVNGKQSSTLFVNYTSIAYSLTLHHNDPLSVISNAIDIKVFIDIGDKKEFDNREIVMRIDSDVHNSIQNGNRIFSTDSNGFQMLQRSFVDKIGVEGNYYPMTTAVFIENVDKTRLSLLTSSSLGVTSPKSGSIEIMIDRKTMIDDRRGLSQGVIDNLRTELLFTLILENNQQIDSDLSPLGNSLSLYLNYPVTVYALEDISIIQQENNLNELKLQNRQFVPPGALCSSFLVNLRTLPIDGYFNEPSNSSLLVLNKKNMHCPIQKLKKHSLHLLNELQISSIQQTTLTGLTVLKNIFNLDELDQQSSHIGAFNITFV